jgi:ABC-2 type transport system permease protein
MLPALLRVSFAAATAYRGELFLWLVTMNMPLVMLVFWSAVADDGPIESFDKREFAAYFLLSFVVRVLTESSVIYEMNTEIRTGTLAMRLLRPIHPILCYALNNIATLPFRFAISLPILIAGLWFVGVDRLTRGLWAWPIAMLAIPGAWLLVFGTMITIGALGLFWESSVALWGLWFGLFVVFSGYIVPLALFPTWIQRLTYASPFPYALSFPVETMLARSPRAELLRELGIQWGYAASFVVCGLTLWSRGVARFAAYGG